MAKVSPVDETQKPPLRYELNVGGVKHLLTAGVPATIPGNMEGVQVSLEPLPGRIFQAIGVSFEYPAEFKFEYKRDKREGRSWEFSAHNFRLVLHEFPQNFDLNAFIQSFTWMAEKGSVCQTSASRKVAGHEYSIEKVSHKTLCVLARAEYWKLPGKDGRRVLLLETFENAPIESAPYSSKALAFLERTLKVD